MACAGKALDVAARVPTNAAVPTVRGAEGLAMDTTSSFFSVEALSGIAELRDTTARRVRSAFGAT
ncbi:hypothetical protein N9L76_05890 [bacterium]|nr:hypothetical protein [bacterium]